MRVTWGAKGQGPDKTAGQDNLTGSEAGLSQSLLGDRAWEDRM